MDHFAGLDVSVKETSACIVDDTGKIVPGRRGNLYDNEGRELYEDAEGRSCLSRGLRDNDRRRYRPFALHRGGLQHTEAPFRSRLPEPGRVRRINTPARLVNR